MIYYLNPPTEDFIADYYETRWNKSRGEESGQHAKGAQKISPRMATLASDLGITNEKTSFLDVGCGLGKLMAGLQQVGFDNIWGTEMSPYRVAVSESRFPGHVFPGGYKNVPPGKQFDVIYSNHVVEHLYSPADFFSSMVEHLSEHGIIAITVPDAWEEYVINQVLFLPHLHSFSAQSLELLGKNYGFSCMFWKKARWEELTVVFYRNLSHIQPYSDQFCSLAELAKKHTKSQLARIRGPWEKSNNGKTTYLTLYRSEKNLEQRRKGFSHLTSLDLALCPVRRAIYFALKNSGLKKSRLSFLCKYGYLKVRWEDSTENIPVISSTEDQATFLIK
ncbi:MAG: hypothetical protein NPIRA04_17610 [Nitrospirales bacterium]|nr:MAG: hypothetical protein NPIRA04_17610 [Nitrospirales bacterium]